jgi:hypothetical protein
MPARTFHRPVMKFASFIAFLSTATAAFAAEQAATAYTALRLVGKQKGQSILNHVIELRGRNGMPQPAVWKIVLAEPEAHGVREIEVQHGKIISERTPVSRGAHGEAMDFSRLNLDSEGVFTIINRETEQQGLPFDRVDYALRSGGGGGAPVWTAELFDGARGKIATIQIAADTGVILAQGKSQGPIANSTPPTDRDFVRPGPPSNGTAYRERSVDDGYSQPGEPFRGVGDFFHRLGKRMERRSEQLENFFTGKKGDYPNDR